MAEPDSEPSVIPPPPPLRGRWRKSALWMAIEVVLISASVFLGLAGQQWLEDRQRAEQARASLRWFRSEIETNQTEVRGKLEYHRKVAAQLRPFARADPKSRQDPQIDFEGLQPPFFERTAWDLALGAQSLADVDRELAFAISRIYRFQDLVDEQTKAMTQAMFLRPPWENGEAFLLIVEPYYSDLIGIEPILLQMYDAVLPQIDAALSE